MKLNRRTIILAVLTMFLVSVTTVWAASVDPIVIGVSSNTTCQQLADLYSPGSTWEEIKFDPNPIGSQTIGGVTVYNGTESGFDWSSTFGIDAVFVKDGTAHNLYIYDYDGDPVTEEMADTYLETPAGDISHIAFCYDVEEFVPLTAEKTAAGSYDRTVTWKLTKSVDDDSHTGYAGLLAGSSTWKVVADKTEVIDNYQVSGSITVYNSNTYPVDFTVSDTLDDGTVAAVDCDDGTAGDQSFGTIPAGGSVTCSYKAYPGDASATLNTAFVTSLTDGVDGATAEKSVTFTENLTGYDEGTLSDPRFEYSQLISGDTTKTFPENFYCSDDVSKYTDGHYQYTVENWAYLNNNINLEDSATVTVDCYLNKLEVSKTAVGSYDRTVVWKLKKSVVPDSHVGFAGDSFNSIWTVTATKTETFGNYQVTGEITIENPSAIDRIFSVSDELNDGTGATVTCPTDTIVAGGKVVCTYVATPADDSATLNTATVSSVGNPDQTATAAVSFTKNLIGDDTVDLTDPYAGVVEPIMIGETTEVPVEDEFSCSSDTEKYKDGYYSYKVVNTAYLVGDITDLKASATVLVECYLLDVTKDAKTSFTRTWTWDIKKTADQTSLNLYYDDPPVAVNYTVTVDAEFVDSDWAVAGSITVYNPAPIDAMIKSVTDMVSPAIAASVDCGVTFPYTLLADKSLLCSYSADLPDAATRKNTATVQLGNSPSGTTNFTGEASVDFAAATITEIDECVDVGDTNSINPLGTVCADQAPGVFYYTLTFGYTDADIFVDCGDSQWKNTADFLTNDNEYTGTADWWIDLTMLCDPGCTLTQGYWKTHSSYGPAPYDATWALVDEDTEFFNTGISWYDLFHMPPKGGDAYIILAHQYMAAYLNVLSGAMIPDEVLAVWNDAGELLKANADTQSIPVDDRADAIMWAGLLDDYNNGLIGPGHCDDLEDTTSYSIGGFFSEVLP